MLTWHAKPEQPYADAACANKDDFRLELHMKDLTTICVIPIMPLAVRTMPCRGTYMQILTTAAAVKLIWFPSDFDVSVVCLSEIFVLSFIDEPSKLLVSSILAGENTLDGNVHEASATPSEYRTSHLWTQFPGPNTLPLVHSNAAFGC